MKIFVIPLMVAASLLVGCNRSVDSVSEQFNGLPADVQKTVRAQAPNAEIISINQTTQDGATVYEFQFRENGRTPKMVVGADGRMISSELTSKPAGALTKLLTPTGAVGTKFSSLPEKVQATIRSKAPDASIANITRHEDNNQVTFEVEFTDTAKNPTLRIAEDGTLAQDLQK